MVWLVTKERVLGFSTKYFFYYLFGYAGFYLQHVGSSAVAHKIQFSDQGSNPCPLHWKCGVLATGPPRKSLF